MLRDYVIKSIKLHNKNIYFYLNQKFKILISNEELAKIVDKNLNDFQQIINTNREKIKENIHFINQKDELYFTKKGLLRLGFILKNEILKEFIENLDDLENETSSTSSSDLNIKNLQEMYRNIQNKLVALSKNLDEEENLEKVTQTFEKLLESSRKLLELEKIQNNQALNTKIKNNNLPKQIVSSSTDLMAKTEDDAYKFATKMEDDAYNFASGMSDKAHNFASNTRDVAYKFATKTEDDAFKFATKMEDDAYHFVSKMAENAYQFASKGMDYGYQFTTQGEELGPMANRILWMASEIGIMADRIGEMADRIVHTEHLIVDTSILIMNFGLLIDGTIKHMSESILTAMSMLLDKEFKPLTTIDKHLELIAKNTEMIITNNHEYDLKVLESQQELRKITISALDKISREY